MNPHHPRRLPAEWEPQSAVLMAWPDETTDWNTILEEAQRCVADILRELSLEQPVILAVNSQEEARQALIRLDVPLAGIRFYQLPYNDTWARDFGPITVMQQVADSPQSTGLPRSGAALPSAETPLLLDWIFNGWGMKFAADRDNMVSRRLSVSGAFGELPVETVPFVLEGGSIESDGRGTVLTTAQCLLDYNRSPGADLPQLEERLSRGLGAERILWLHHGRLIGDDTDAHIDTLVRFCSPTTIAYTRCDDPEDEHYHSLQAMQLELEALRTVSGEPYRLVPLPLPSAIHDDHGERLPATYANFLITNHSVWVPQYGVAEDARAFSTMIGLFPGRSIRGVDCLPLIRQHGSLHCITMQLPEGVIDG